MRRRRAAAVSLLLALACARRAAPPALTADDVVTPYVPVRFGMMLSSARQSLPRLAATGWKEGTRSTWLDPLVEAGLEVELDSGRVRAIAITFGPSRSDEVEAELRGRLGPGVACSALPEGISSFQPTLWRTADGGAVSLVRKQKILQLRVERPATPAFEQAWGSCKT